MLSEIIIECICWALTILWVWVSLREVKKLATKPEEFDPFGAAIFLVLAVYYMVLLVQQIQ